MTIRWCYNAKCCGLTGRYAPAEICNGETVYWLSTTIACYTYTMVLKQFVMSYLHNYRRAFTASRRFGDCYCISRGL